MELKAYEVAMGRKLAVALVDIKAIDWRDREVTVAKAGDTVKVLDMDYDLTWIEVADWEFEVLTATKNIQLVEAE